MNALQAHGPGGQLAYFGTYFVVLDGKLFTFSDPCCDLDAHYGEGFVKRLGNYAMLAAFAVQLLPAVRPPRLRPRPMPALSERSEPR